MSVYTFW